MKVYFAFLLALSVIYSGAVPVVEPEPAELTEAEFLDHKSMERSDLLGGDILGIAPSNTADGTPWTNKIIPYVIHSSLSQHTNAITRAMQEYHSKTCIKFQPRRSERNYIELRNGQGCNSYVGMRGGSQPVNLELPGCVYHGTIVHELGHAIGFLHTHQRDDRDRFINIDFSNVDPQMRSAFNIERRGRKLVPYDTSSVMHYYSFAFARDRNKPTITTKNGGRIEYANQLSPSDITAIKALYRC